jgi:hypothetical protein
MNSTKGLRPNLISTSLAAGLLCLLLATGAVACPIPSTDVQVGLSPVGAKNAMRSGLTGLRVLCPDYDCRIRAQLRYERSDGARIATEDIARIAVPLGPRQVRKGVWPGSGRSGVPLAAGKWVTLPIRLQTRDFALQRAAAAGGAVARVRVEALPTEEDWSVIGGKEAPRSYPGPLDVKGRWTRVADLEVPLSR